MMRPRDPLEPWLIAAAVAVGLLSLALSVVVVIDRIEAG